MNISSDDQSIFLENVMDTIRESLIVLDEHMRVLTVNRSFLNTFKVSSEETEGRLIYELGNGQWNIPELHTLLENIIPDQATIESFEVKHHFETIGEKVLKLNARRLLRANGKSAMILLAISDITEDYFIRREMEVSEANYRKFTEEANSIVIGLDHQGTITFFNKFSEKVFGHQRNEVLGRPFLGTIIPPIDSSGKDTSGILSELLVNPEKVTIREMEGLHKDGSFAYISFSAKAIRGVDGSINEIIIDGNDYTELRAARRLLTEKSSTLDTLLTFIPYGVIICDLDDVVRYTSRAMEAVFKVPLESIINVNGNECLQKINLYHADGRQITSTEELPMYKVVRSGKPSGEYNLTLKQDGSTRILSIDAAPIFDSGNNITGAIGIWHDLTEEKKAERALLESAKLFRAAVDNYTSLFVIYDKNRRMQFMNKYGLEIIGVTEEQVTGKTDEEIIPAEVYQHYLPYLIRALETKEKQHFEFDFTIEGNSFSYVNDYVPLLGDNHEVYLVLSIAMDITARKRSEKAMEVSEERFRTLADNISQLAWMADMHGILFWFNKRWYEFTGTTYDEIMEKGLGIVVHPDYFEKVMAGYLDAVQKGEPWTETFPMRKKDGTYRWFLSHAMPIYDRDHTIMRWFGTNTDVTDLHDIREELRLAAERFDRIMSSNIIGMVISDLNGGIISANQYYYNLTGYSEEEILQNNIMWTTLTAPEYAPVDARAVDELRRFGTCTPYEKEYIRKDGTRVWILIGVTLLPNTQDQGIAFLLDITNSKRALNEAQQRRAEIEAILDSIPDGYIFMDRDGLIEKTNDRARSLLGLTKQIEALPLADRIEKLSFLDEKGIKYPLEQLPSWRALHGETVRDLIIQVKKDEITNWVVSSASPIIYNGKMLGAILEFIDITQRHKLQEEIDNEKNFVNAILQTSGALITVLDENFRIIRFNNACEELTGYTTDEVMNQSVMRLFVPDEEYPGVLKIVERLTSGETSVEHENHWKTRSGEKRFIRWRNSVLIGPSGNVSFIVSIGIDITDRKKFEEQLQKYKDRLEYDFDVMNRLHEIASIFVGENETQRVFDQIVDTAAAIAHDNMGSLQLLDRKSKSLLLRSSRGLSDRWVEFWKVIEKCDGICEQTINKKRREIIENVAVNTLYKGKPSYEIQLAEGISALQSTPIISRSGELLGILTTYNYKPGRPDDHSLWILDLLARQTADIIDRINTQQTLAESKKQLEEHTEELYEANRDLESFSYSVSHDLRGPLSVMKGLTDIIEEDYADKYDDEGRAYLQNMRSSVEKMMNLIDDILNLSRIGRLEVKREKVDLSSMVYHYLEELSSLGPARKTEFIIEENVTVNADPRLVHVELENLLRNSWKFTSKKDVTRIEFGQVHLDGKVAFFVKDNGVGFDQKFADTIFEPFRRVHADKEYGGTGIGLSIVQRVIKKHNGKVWAEGTPGKGAVFYFTLG
jgi:PAS domain S-box-containing protein